MRRRPFSAVYFSEHDVERTQDGRYVGEKVPFAQMMHRLEMRKTWRTDLALVRHICAVGDEIDPELTFRRFDRNVDFSSRNMESFSVQLEVMYQSLHGTLHLAPTRWSDLVVLN